MQMIQLIYDADDPTDTDTEAQSSEHGDIAELDDEDIELLESD